ncbi:cytochrome P450 [Glomus cerebriforme]|uniref:Cytochrome P450 n=1 Tax=Glomus cerebriforme TaxID=658196 RepID=A0A397SEX1_9GLOM|nr:cytochrome P450 [Glomus cerebriforme]
MMTPSFNHQAVEWTNELWVEMESYWNNLGEDHELNLIKWMHRFSNEMIFIISSGSKNNSVASYYHTLIPENYNKLNDKEKEKIKESEDFIHSLETLLRGAVYFYFFNRFMRHYVPFIRGKANSLLKNRDYLYDKIYNIIKKRRIEIENTPLDQPLRHDMLTSYITANTSRDINIVRHGETDPDLLRPMTDKEIFGNILDAMGGGTDTTANLFCFVVYYLGRYPEVKRKLQQELDIVLGKDLKRPITYKDIDELQYCDAVIKEVYRHFPVAFSLGRVNVEKDIVGGFNWPEETSFLILYSAIMRRKDYWTDPEKFDPDRFYKIDESDKYLLEKINVKNSFSIFGGGIRICPGRKLAMIELKCLLASIYRKYDLVMVDENAPLNYDSGFINVCKELMIKVKPRKF